MTIWTKIATLTLALLMALSCFAFVACTDDTPSAETPDTPSDGAASGDTPSAETPDTPDESADSEQGEDYLLRIPQQNYGTTFTTLTGESRRGELYIEDEDDAAGDLIDTAIFYRNNRVAEYLGITIENISTGGDWVDRTSYINRIYTSYSTGDQDFQLASCYMAYAADGAVAGYYYDVNSIEAIDLESPWYVQDWFENTIINDQCYMILGDLSYTMWRNLNAIYFNKDIADEIGVGDLLYTMAEEGDWTFEYLMECAQLSSADNGNDIWDEEDTYGLYLNRFNCRAMVTYFDIPLTQLNADGEYELCLYNERTETIYGTLHSYIWDNDCVYKNTTTNDGDFGTGKTMFLDNRLLFLPGTLINSQDLREMEGAWGILPSPKLDDQQDGYHTHSNDTLSVFLIPGHAADVEFCGTVTDALGAENKYSVIPTFYEVVLKGRTTKDEQSVAMLDIIREDLTFDFAFAHLTAMESMWTHFGQNLLTEANTSFKPSYDKKAETYQAKLEEILDSYWDAR